MIGNLRTLAAAVLVASAGSASAATLGLELLPTNGALPTPAVTSVATFTADSNQLLIDNTGLPVMCGSVGPASGPTCLSDFTIEFNDPGGIRGISFAILDPITDTGADSVTISFFDTVGGFLIDTTITDADLTSTALGVNFTFIELLVPSPSSIGSIVFDDNSTALGQGFLYGEFSFAPVPLPAALPLLAFGLGALGFARRKARQS